MNDNDDTLKQALSQEFAKAPLRYGDEETLVERVAGTFRTRARWLIVLVWFWVLVFFILTILCAVWFFAAESTRDQIMFATLFLFCGLAVSLLKTWYYMEMNKHTHTREIKRLEIQIARLAERIGAH